MRAYTLTDRSELHPRDLEAHGVHTWTVPHDEAERARVIDTIKSERGYVDQDFVELSAETPNLDAICAKFDREHAHTEDEVRFVVDGEGIFDIRDGRDEWIRIEVATGDIIVIPANKHHRFYLTDRRHIRCMRLFANHDGWSPIYRETATV